MSSVSISFVFINYISRQPYKETSYDNFLFTLHSTVEITNLTMVMYNFDETKLKSNLSVPQCGYETFLCLNVV